MNHTENRKNNVNPLEVVEGNNDAKNQLHKALELELPLIVSRKLLSKILGGLISARTIANRDCLGLSPKVKVRIGRNIGYTRQSVLEWLEELLQVANV